MNHKSKTVLFKCLDVLPEQLGFYLYHKLQQLFAKDMIDYKIESTRKSLETIVRILNKNGFELKNKHIIELGSGWLPILPYLLKYNSNANRVDTYDINKHYKLSEIVKLNVLFSKKYGIPPNTFDGVFQLPKDIRYFPYTDICNGDFINADLAVSRFVLEHVSPESIIKIHETFREKLKSGSYIVHLISPSDHRAYSDSSLSLYDFLKYSNEEWDSIQTKFDYHNRIRLPQYLQLFEKNFEIVSLEFDSCKEGSEQHRKFKKFKINELYENYSDEELTAGSIAILLKVR
jgi:hypothetical protein